MTYVKDNLDDFVPGDDQWIKQENIDDESFYQSRPSHGLIDTMYHALSANGVKQVKPDETPMMTPPVGLFGLNGPSEDASHSPSNLFTPQTDFLRPLPYQTTLETVNDEEAKPLYDDNNDPDSWKSLFESNGLEIVKDESLKKAASQKDGRTPENPVLAPAAVSPTSGSTTWTAPITVSGGFQNFTPSTYSRGSSSLSLSGSSFSGSSKSLGSEGNTTFISYDKDNRPPISTRHSAPELVSESSASGCHEDKAKMKRIRNTEAARRSRARKLERMSELEQRCDMLMNRNRELEMEVIRLRLLLSKMPLPDANMEETIMNILQRNQ